MKKNAFTLIELLSVIVILAIVLIIAVPGVLNVINKTKNNAYKSQLEMVKAAAKNYISASSETITWNGTTEQVATVSLKELQNTGYIDKKLIDPRDKSVIQCLNVQAKKNQTNKITYSIYDSCNKEQPIHPKLSYNMIPITYNGTNWIKANQNNNNFSWFNYGNNEWANIATVTDDVRSNLLSAPIGTVIPMDKINGMYVWIPRFKYKVFNVDGTINPLNNKNLINDFTIDITFETKSTTKSLNTKNGEYLTHPAFTYNNEELDGFWVAKFETGYNGATSETDAFLNTVDSSKIIIKPNSFSWRGYSISNAFQNITNMKNNNNVFGLTNTDDPHLIKSTEWGAVAYLTNSKYGKTGNVSYPTDEKPLRVNNNINYITGCGASSQNDERTNTCNQYDTKDGQSSSTTGNITGIYDMVGSGWEYIGNIGKTSPTDNAIIASAGFDQTELNRLANENKYFDVYLTANSYQEFNHSILGDAILEIGPIVEGVGSWQQDKVDFITNECPWFVKGGSSDLGGSYTASENGIFRTSCTKGDSMRKGSSRITLK